ESEVPSQCTFLNKYVLSQIAHDASREAVLNIAYAYDQNGVVSVTAEDPRTSTTLPIRAEPLPADMSWVERSPEEQAWAPEPVFIYLAVDVSGSMSGGPLAEAKKAARGFLANLDLGHCSFGIMSVADQVAVNLQASQNAHAIERAIDGLQVGLGGGNSAEPF